MYKGNILISERLVALMRRHALVNQALLTGHDQVNQARLTAHVPVKVVQLTALDREHRL